MEIRNVRLDELEKSLELAQYAFQYMLNEEEKKEAQEKYIPERNWGLFEDEQLVAKLVIIPLEVYLHGRVFSMGGIGGVASWPEHRRSGWVSLLLRHALQVMNDSGQMLSFLHPFSVAFYRKFGWEMLSDFKKYIVTTDKFPPKEIVEGKVCRDVVDIATLDRIYQKYAIEYNGTLVRDESWWERSVLDDDGHTAVFYNASGEASGYLLYKIENKELLVDEFVYLTDEARVGLWTFLSNHDSMVTKIVFTNIPANDMLPYTLPDPRIGQEFVPYGMARIVNVKRLLEAFPFKPTEHEGHWKIQIKDRDAPWNEGIWSVNINGEGKSTVGLLNETANDGDEKLSCDISTFSAMLIGYMRPTELHRLGRLTGPVEMANMLDQIIAPQQTLFMDYF
ncbi:GNAT family N-acetyltransferase [Paenibacillus pini]|uniref:N-acetyltransferase domain-containing protein n=1 Tax=Paenibacillus pini JCM 16418 TaxID=1236976 RepID=W7YH25_9BACL|nr:GNAT family N-acetyltransferase [Paenibacillus pini]GAF10210.1 hypothetical protein JCM16418_4387 [Paenibacillus pini JCM 16418]